MRSLFNEDSQDNGERFAPGNFSIFAPVLRNAITGLQVPFWSFLIPALIAVFYDLTWYPPYLPEVLFKIALFTMPALGFALLFNLAFSALRLIASVFNRIEKIWSYAAPGVALFFLVVEPVFTFYRIPSPEATGSWFYIYSITLAAIALPVLFFFPVFRGANATFVIGSILLVRSVHYFLEPEWPGSHTQFFIWNHIWFIVESSLLFVALHIRNLIYLTPGFERPRIPLTIASAIGTLWVLSLMVLVFLFHSSPEQIQTFFHGVAGEKEPLFFFLPHAWAIFVLSLMWLLWALVLASRVRREYESSLGPEDVFSMGLILLVFLLPALLGLIPAPHHWKYDSDSLPGMVLTYSALQMDSDHDANSAWPGLDPQDDDPCIRKRFHLPCKNNDGQKSIDGPDRDFHPEEEFQKVRQKANISPGHIREGSLIVLSSPLQWRTILSSNFIKKSVASFEIQLPGEGETQVQVLYREQLMPLDEPMEAVSAMLAGLNGLDYYRGVDRESVISTIALAGYRTICLARTVDPMVHTTQEESNLRSANSDPGRGCQVYDYEPTESRTRQPVVFTQAVDRALDTYREYREHRSYYLFYYENHPDEAAPNPQKLLQLVNNQVKRGPVVLVLLHPENLYQAELIEIKRSYFRRNRRYREYANSQETSSSEQLIHSGLLAERILASLGMNPERYQMDISQNDAIGVIATEPEPLYTLPSAETKQTGPLPLRTYQRTSRGVEIYDGLRGTLEIIEPPQ